MMLTTRQQAFVNAKLDGMGNKRAAMIAGYAAAGAAVRGSNMMRHPKVIAAIKAAKAEAGVDTRSEREAKDDDRRLKDHYETSLDLLRDVYNNPNMPFSVRYQAAKDALAFEIMKPGAKGKKGNAKEEAHEIAAVSKFGVGRKPNLRAVA